MDLDEFMEKLEQRLNSVLITAEDDKELGLTANGFNCGARTMYNYALVVAYEMQKAERQVS